MSDSKQFRDSFLMDPDLRRKKKHIVEHCIH